MSQREKLNPNKIQRTSIEEISAVGNELSEEHLRLASGGAPTGGALPPRGWHTQGSVRSANGQTDSYVDKHGPADVGSF